MIEPFRSDFNARFTDAKYAAFKDRLNRETGTDIQFRMAETPCFFPADLLDTMIEAGVELTSQLWKNSQYLEQSKAAIPSAYNVPGQGTQPHFMTVDFGLVRGPDGELEPKLVEMQAFPSIFGFQPGFARAYKEIFELDDRLQYLYAGQDEASYWALLQEVVVAQHDPATVVLLEVDPENQKTLPDFRRHEQHLGIRTVDIRTVVKQGNQLLYRDAKNHDRLTPIKRIYNRAIVDEVVRRKIELPFDYRDPLNVEWAGHPNWYFQISKFSLPFLHHRTVPTAIFLDEWMDGKGRDKLSPDREQWVLKPLYSFAGTGIQFAPSDADLRSIPPDQRHDYLLQERVQFEPVIATPEGMTQAEVRILYVWPEGKSMVPMTSLVRMGRGLMMGVDHNRDRTWVGGSAAFFLPHSR
ncbi:MAG: hypothetical protein ACRYFU_09055 [Janthinobacterium lividum]